MFDRCVELCGSGIGVGAKFGGLSDDELSLNVLGAAGSAAGGELLLVGLGVALGAFKLGAPVLGDETLDGTVLG